MTWTTENKTNVNLPEFDALWAKLCSEWWFFRKIDRLHNIIYEAMLDLNYDAWDRGRERAEEDAPDCDYCETFSDGFNEGRQEGYSEGKSAGYDEGYERGYSEGYEEGYIKAGQDLERG